ncbi:MAG TPA: hypothetical protein VI233_13650 [Puia sp.]
MNKRLSLPISLLFLLVWGGCKKSEVPDACALIPQVKITGNKQAYFVGDTIQLGTTISPLGLYSWKTTNSLNAISNSDRVYISSCTKDDEGWYYLSVSNPDCVSHFDSVYISVRNKPVTASCTPSDNTVTFSSIPNLSFGSCTWGPDPSFGRRVLSAVTPYGYPDFKIYFNPYWDSKEPEDGAYDISPEILFDQNNVYTIYFSSTYQSIYFEAGTGKAYVSHTGGKLRVTFCSLTFTGSLGGRAYTTTASGKLAAP